MACKYIKCADKSQLDARIEVKSNLPEDLSVMKRKFLISWNPTGEAEFHPDCWKHVLGLSRSRKKQNEMCAEEKKMVKTAAKAMEKFDPRNAVIKHAKTAAKLIVQSKHCVAFTGAGISTSAGIGDYRGKSGKWTEEDRGKEAAMNGASQNKRQRLEEVEEEVDENVEEDGVPYEKLRPTYTHEALYKLMVDGYLKYIISQNGDGLHGLSGVGQEYLSELHGNVFMEKCEKCDTRYARPYYVLDDAASQYYEELEDYGTTDVKKPSHATKCDYCGLCHRTGRNCTKKVTGSRKCGGFLRDTIINFRDHLEEEIFKRAEENCEKCDLMICLGTTLQVYPAADLLSYMPEPQTCVICNRQETDLDETCSKTGVRVFGDCDMFMKEVMRNVYNREDLKRWESERPKRMEQCQKFRDS